MPSTTTSAKMMASSPGESSGVDDGNNNNKEQSVLPLEIQNCVEQELLLNAFVIEKVEFVKSAQHLVAIVSVSPKTTTTTTTTTTKTNSSSFSSLSSSQLPTKASNYCGVTDHVSNTISSSLASSSSSSSHWQHALQIGNHHLVIRIWKGACRWWNLHQNNSHDDVANYHSHHSNAVLTLARAEIAGYRMARYFTKQKRQQQQQQPFDSTSDKSERDDDKDKDCCLTHGEIVIPQVLYFSHDGVDRVEPNAAIMSKNKESNLIWAVFAYVGKESLYLQPHHQPHHHHHHCFKDYPNPPPYIYDDSWTTSMIVWRHEFGWDEPHPRWGRLSISSCWDYAATLLRTWIIPLHEYCFSLSRIANQQQNQYVIPEDYHDWIRDLAVSKRLDGCFHRHDDDDDKNSSQVSNQQETRQHQWRGRTFLDMVSLYALVHQDLSHQTQSMSLVSKTQNSKTPAATTGTAAKDDQVTTTTCHDDDNDDDEQQKVLLQWVRWIHQLGLYISQLKQEALELQLFLQPVDFVDEHLPHWLPHVLCHMDLQPQNLLCHRQAASPNNYSFGSNGSNISPRHRHCRDKAKEGDDNVDNSSGSIWIFSVLDWEEAAYADPRFEILLLCRKVCANLEQARWIWNVYATECRLVVRDDGNKAVDATVVGVDRMGPMEPWLRLETVHSITTLLLQGMPTLISLQSDQNKQSDATTTANQKQSPSHGRNPWETQQDLHGKLQREFQRLETQWPFSS